jgi:glucose-6-phosphate isomerase
MKNIEFSYAASCGVDAEQLKTIGGQLRPEIERITAAQKSGYDSVYASLNLAKDKKLREAVHDLAQEKKKLQPTALVVIGIGGSNLGTVAVLEAVFGRFYNEQQPDIKVYFADTVDTDHIYDIVLLVEQELEKGNNVIVAMMSKSGATMETVANAEVFIYLLKKSRPEDYHRYVVTITDEGSKLWDLAGVHKFDRLAIPMQVGGRYSVFSAVGLFPLAMIGVDINTLHAGAQSIIPACTNTDIFTNPAALSAAILFSNYKKGFFIHDTFLFSVDLESLGKWYRQLMGESIGKTRKTDHEPVGMTPTVSIGSTDLHSVAQLYLGGPHDKFTTFVSIEKNKSDVRVPAEPILQKLVASLGRMPLSSIMNAILKGVKLAYIKQELPFVEVVIAEKSVSHIAQFMQLKMLEMMYLGYLLEVNPFDQPHVELYKDETRKMLDE